MSKKNRFEAAFDRWVDSFSAKELRVGVGILIVIVGFLFIFNFYWLGIEKMCGVSGGELFKNSDGVRCVNMSSVDVCTKDDILHKKKVNTYGFDLNISVNISD